MCDLKLCVQTLHTKTGDVCQQVVSVTAWKMHQQSASELSVLIDHRKKPALESYHGSSWLAYRVSWKNFVLLSGSILAFTGPHVWHQSSIRQNCTSFFTFLPSTSTSGFGGKLEWSQKIQNGSCNNSLLACFWKLWMDGETCDAHFDKGIFIIQKLWFYAKHTCHPIAHVTTHMLGG